MVPEPVGPDGAVGGARASESASSGSFVSWGHRSVAEVDRGRRSVILDLYATLPAGSQVSRIAALLDCDPESVVAFLVAITVGAA